MVRGMEQMISSKELKVDPDSMKINIEVDGKPKVILINEGRVREIELPHHGEFIIKTAQGKLQKYEQKEGELF
jgi:hypothetical protein